MRTCCWLPQYLLEIILVNASILTTFAIDENYTPPLQSLSELIAGPYVTYPVLTDAPGVFSYLSNIPGPDNRLRKQVAQPNQKQWRHKTEQGLIINGGEVKNYWCTSRFLCLSRNLRNMRFLVCFFTRFDILRKIFHIKWKITDQFWPRFSKFIFNIYEINFII